MTTSKLLVLTRLLATPHQSRRPGARFPDSCHPVDYQTPKGAGPMTHLARTAPMSPWKNRLVTPTEARIPEPAQLYSLIGLTLIQHGPAAGGTCTQCDKPWPCTQALQAYRLREGF